MKFYFQRRQWKFGLRGLLLMVPDQKILKSDLWVENIQITTAFLWYALQKFKYFPWLSVYIYSGKSLASTCLILGKRIWIKVTWFSNSKSPSSKHYLTTILAWFYHSTILEAHSEFLFLLWPFILHPLFTVTSFYYPSKQGAAFFPLSWEASHIGSRSQMAV